MALTPGTRIGSYEITAQIGVGGMGEVYRATDTHLARQVAIKVLPDAVAADAERLARFDREAKTLAALNHPNIAQIYGLERSEGQTALVMELVEGPTLADRIAHGPIPVDEALAFAKQIAEALEAAHEQGIIHRDLKPANVKVRPDGTVKVLDFGLAKAMDPVGSLSPGLSQSPTITTPAMTQAGMILGTAAYMSPEQARGRATDKRSDIWAFGVVLYEMLTGRRAFPGEDVTDTVAAVVKLEPDWGALADDVPARVGRALRVCLRKDPRQRGGDIAAIRLALDGAFETVAARPAGGPADAASPGSAWWRRAGPWAAAVLLGVFATIVAWYAKPVDPRPVVRAEIAPQNGRAARGTRTRALAISPDGLQAVFNLQDGLYLRPMDAVELRVIPGTEEPLSYPVFSPDGSAIAFVQAGQLRRIAVTGGRSVPLAPAPDLVEGMRWEDDGMILYTQDDGLWQVSGDGGEPEQLIPTETGAILGAQRLPGGDWVLLTMLTQNSQSFETDVVVQNLQTEERRVVRPGGASARYLPTGHLVYSFEGALFAVPFNVDRLETIGSPVQVVDGVTTNALGSAQFDVSDTGTLLYVPGLRGASSSDRALVVADRAGKVTQLDVAPGPYVHVRASPDGTRLALDRDDGSETNVWTYDLDGGSAVQRLTFAGRNRFPVWSPDSRRLAFQSDRDGDLAIYVQAFDGVGGAERVTTPEEGQEHIPESWSPDGEHLVFSVLEDSEYTLSVLSVAGGTVEPFGEVRSLEPLGAVFSPSGMWIAYHSLPGSDTALDISSGIFVEPFPATHARYQAPKVLRDFQPFWSPDGQELFYVGSTASAQLAVTRFSTASGVVFGTPSLVPFVLTAGRLSAATRSFDVLPDGRFVGLIAPSTGAEEDSAVSQVPQFVVNWFEELKRLVPTP